jgi:hypothetical protein
VVSLPNCQIESRFQDARDLTHVSVVATVSLGLNSFPSLFLTVSNVTFKDAELQQLQDEFPTFRIPRGYMTIPVMALYVQQIIALDTEFMRTRFNEQGLTFDLSIDNHSVHNGSEILPLYSPYVVVQI